jgi:hypothetical protein
VKVLVASDLETRLMSRVARTDGCWLWTGYVQPNGYAQLWCHGKREYVHRVMFQLRVGPIPDDKEIDHRCNVRHCVRPDHLRLLDHAENVKRGFRRRTTCKNGHPYTGDNIYWWRGRRHCRECRRHHDRQRA